jgi:hypothetical protein
VNFYEVRKKLGRCSNGSERDTGRTWHLIERGSWTAACGARPGRTSAGWSEPMPQVERQSMCRNCLRKFESGAAQDDVERAN